MMSKEMSGAEMVVEALNDQGVEILFGYPGGAVLPIYDVLFQQEKVQHILVRHEQGAAHAAEGYARSSGKVGVLLVTSGPGATNTVTGLTDALMDSIPIVCITGQVPTHLIGSDAFQECDTVGITRHCTKHNYLVKNIADLPRVLHEAFYVASSGRPGPGGHRHPQGRAVCARRLRPAAQRRAQDLSSQARRRHGGDAAGRAHDGGGEASDLLHGRRRHQFRTRGVDAAARTRRASRAFPSPRR